jgi:Fur family ferric uptake transcriptional regulator
MSCFETLKAKGLKLTPQRLLILKIINENKDNLAADEIISFVKSKIPKANKSTIYRTLEILEEAGCVYKSVVEGKAVYHHAEGGHHHHLVCHKCGKIIDFDENLFTEAEKELWSKYGFFIDFKHMVFPGLCAECMNRR